MGLLAPVLAAGAVRAAPATPAATPLVAGAVSERSMVVLPGDTAVASHVVQDQGALAGSQVLEHLQLALKRSPERQAALDALVAEQQDPASPNYHKWVSPEEFGAAYGPSDADVAKTVAWLTRHGFAVGAVSPNRMSLEFSGTAAQVSAAFRTELHSYVARDGRQHVANAAAPAIPAALEPVVFGVTLSNFFPHPTVHPVGAVQRSGSTGALTITKPAPGYTVPVGSSTYYAVTPQDLATIYNINPARNGTPLITDANGKPLPVTGTGVTLIVAEQTNIKPEDWTNFRQIFGLSGYTGTLQSIHPGGCADPGFTGDEGEAALDAEWSSAAAPDATIIEASCAGTATTFGVMTTLQNLVNVGPRGAIVSISYGGCETGNGLSFLQMWTQLIEQGAAEGISIFVSSGDNGVAGCDNDNTEKLAVGGLAVNGLASNPYDTAVGGTDFSDTADGTNSTYWSATNTASDGSALSYIPEIPWDDSCASSVIWKASKAPNGIAYCNEAKQPLLNIVGGSGGKSLYYSKPDWQAGVPGIPNDHVRGLPDVSLFASNGIWAHFYLFCMSDTNEGGAPCIYTNQNDLFANAAGGTSFSAPIFAGIEALVVQLKGGPVGNAAPRLYQLAQLQFALPTLVTDCNSSRGNRISTACVFNVVTRGNNAEPCKAGTPNCFTNAASTNGIGILSSSSSTENDAYPTRNGWSFATGLGSVNVTNLLLNY
jgi:subtilase family serine protease